jgi:ABC-type polysaccharide/polyol phosphate export permease
VNAVATTTRAATQASNPAAKAPIRVIEPWKPGIFPRIREIWRERRLLTYFGRRYLQRRYQNTWLGWLWLPLRPALDMVSKALFFGGFLGVSSGDRPYIIFYAFGTCGWVLFESITRWGIRGLKFSNKFIKNGYSPRMPRVIGLVFPALLDLLLYTIVAIAAVFYFLFTTGTMYIVPSKELLVGVAGIALLAVWGIVVVLWMAPLTVHARDIRLSFSYITQFWYFLTPIAYPISSLPTQYQPIAEHNPLTAPVEMVKYGFLQTAPATTTAIVSCFVGLAVVGSGGLWLFNRMEHAAVERL